MNEVNANAHTRNLGVIVAEIREDLKQFLNTRLQLLKSEIHEIFSAIQVALPLGAVALVLLGTGFLLITAAIVTIVASAFSGNPYAWFYAFIIVGFVWIAIGAISALFAFNEFRSRAMFPKRTIATLKADKNWIETETRTNYDRAA